VNQNIHRSVNTTYLLEYYLYKSICLSTIRRPVHID
jgi:hypothetical protein